jgi:hypothetical protein
VFLLYGICVLQPWNAVVTCFDFFAEELPSHNVFNVFPFSVYAFQIFSMSWFIVYGQRYSYHLLISGSLAAIGCFIIVMPFLAHTGDTSGFWSCLVALMVFGLFAGASQAAAFSLAGTMPFRISGAIMLGCSVSGLFSNILRAITLSTIPDAHYDSAIIFFVISAVYVWTCALAYKFILEKSAYFQYY